MSPFETICPWLSPALALLEEAATRNQLGHGWLISGPDGIGKTNLAHVLADRLLRGSEGSALPPAATPAQAFSAYRALQQGVDLHPDLHRICVPADKNSIGVEQIRDLIGDLGLKPHLAQRKIVVIERAEKMTTEAVNALLKSLEEPTPSTYLLLLTNRPGRLPATIRSRCQRLTLKSPEPAAARQWFAAVPEADDRMLADIGLTAPIAAALLLLDKENAKQYRKIQSHIDDISNNRCDLRATAQDWLKGDLDLALGCLVRHLQLRIRCALIPGASNPVTDCSAPLADNRAESISADSLFRCLKMAENLRDELGRGTNVEIALKSLLLGLEHNERQRVTS